MRMRRAAGALVSQEAAGLRSAQGLAAPTGRGRRLFSGFRVSVVFWACCLQSAHPFGPPSPDADYPSWPAGRKASYLWAKITANETGGAFMGSFKTLICAGRPDYLQKMESIALDWRESGHQKITHGVGGHARAHIVWTAPSEYTGMFQRADHCIVRMANAAVPGGLAIDAYGPNLAIKCLNDGPQSANVQALWQLDGYAVLPPGKTKSCSYFEAPLATHTPLRDNITAALRGTFVPDFQKVDPHSMLIGVSQLAGVDQAGTPTPPAAVRFPFGLVFQPRPELNAIPCEFEQYISQLKRVPSNSTLYDVYAVAEPWLSRPSGRPMVTKLGELRLDSGFVGSTYGDSELFFRHTFFAEELAQLPDRSRRAAWETYINDTVLMKSEGAMLYAPFLPAPP